MLEAVSRSPNRNRARNYLRKLRDQRRVARAMAKPLAPPSVFAPGKRSRKVKTAPKIRTRINMSILPASVNRAGRSRSTRKTPLYQQRKNSCLPSKPLSSCAPAGSVLISLPSFGQAQFCSFLRPNGQGEILAPGNMRVTTLTRQPTKKLRRAVPPRRG